VQVAGCLIWRQQHTYGHDRPYTGGTAHREAARGAKPCESLKEIPQAAEADTRYRVCTVMQALVMWRLLWFLLDVLECCCEACCPLLLYAQEGLAGCRHLLSRRLKL